MTMLKKFWMLPLAVVMGIANGQVSVEIFNDGKRGNLAFTTGTITADIRTKPTPCTPEEIESDRKQKLLSELEQKGNPNVVFQPSLQCEGWGASQHGTVRMALVKGGKVAIEPGYTPEQVIIRILEMWVESTQKIFEQQHKRDNEARASIDAYVAATEKYEAALKNQIAIQGRGLDMAARGFREIQKVTAKSAPPKKAGSKP